MMGGLAPRPPIVPESGKPELEFNTEGGVIDPGTAVPGEDPDEDDVVGVGVGIGVGLTVAGVGLTVAGEEEDDAEDG